MSPAARSVLSLAAALPLAASLPAQWSVSADAPVAGFLTAASGPNGSNASVSVGPVPAGSLGNVTSYPASAAGAWAPGFPGQVGAVAFEVTASASSGWSSAPPVFAVCSFTLDLRLDPPAATTGLLVLEAVDTELTGSVGRSVDVDADGTVELSGGASGALVPLTIPASGAVVRVQVSCLAGSFLAPAVSAVAATRVRGRFLPGKTIVERFDAYAPPTFFDIVGLTAAPLGDDRWQLGVTALDPGFSPLLTVFGFQPTTAPLLPGLTQLVSVDAVLPGGAFVFDLPPMPAGFALYAQHLGVAGSGALRSSNNSLRALWF